MKLQKWILYVLTIAMIFSLCAVPAMAEEPATSENVIFICDGAEGDGSSADSPLKPTTGNYDPDAAKPEKDQDAALYQAWQKLMALGGGTIVICGPYTLNNDNCQPIGGASSDFMMPVELYDPSITITYTSVWDGVDYRQTNGAELIMAGRSHLTFPTATVMQDITVRATDDNVDHYIAGGLNPLTLGRGTNFIPYEEDNVDAYPMVLGAFRNNNVGLKEGDSHIVIDIGDENTIGNVFGMCNGGNGKHVGNTYITIKSGNIAGVYGDSRATGQVPQMGDINITFEGGIYRGLIAGVNIGFSGKCDKVINIKITGGDFSDCKGILANTTAADALMPEALNVDCSEAPLETAQQVKMAVTAIANLTLPEGYTDPTPPATEPVEEPTDPVEETQAPTQAPADTAPNSDEAGNSTVLIVAVIGVVAVAIAVILGVSKKKKQ